MPFTNRSRVLVTVRGGVAEAFYDASEAMVEIVDYDEYDVQGKDPDPYLDDLVRHWGFPDPRKARNDASANQPTDTDRVLYKLVTEDAQEVAVREIGRELTEDELGVVACEIGDYIDWDHAMTYCIRQEIAEES